MIRFLQGRDPSLALRIVGRAYLARGPALRAGASKSSIHSAFGELGTTEQARYLASLYVDDLADVLRDGIDPRFELSRYGEKLAASAARFDPLPRRSTRRADAGRSAARRDRARAGRAHTTRRGRPHRALPRQRLRRVPHRAGDPKPRRPATTLVLGGGYVNTELRELARRRACSTSSTTSRSTTASGRCSALIEHLARSATRPLLRTYVREGGAVVLEARRRRRTTSPPRHRHADLRRPAARSLRVAVRDAEPDAPAVVGRALEQADRRARLLLEEVHVLRRVAGLHRPLRAGAGRRHRRPHRGAGARDRADAASTSSTRRRRRRRCARWPSA